MTKHNFSIFKYFSKLLKAYADMQKLISNELFRVVEKKIHVNGNIILVVQVVGKSICFEMTPTEIISDESLLLGFSKKDIKMICYLTCEKKFTHKIVSQNLCVQRNRILYKIESKDTNKIIVQTADEISQNKPLVRGLSSEDTLSIGYSAGYEKMMNEQSEIEKLEA